MKHIFLSSIILLVVNIAAGQNTLSLKQAIENGIKNNLEVNRADLQVKSADIVLKQSKANILPDLNAVANHGINQGRSIDPISNSFINQTFNYASYGLNTNVLLFNGLSLQNRIKANALGHDASKMELQQAKDNLTINIILAYLQVLRSQDILENTNTRLAVTRSQVERLEILNREGAITPAVFYDLKGQLAEEEISVTDNQAALASAKLDLSQLMNMPYNKDLQLERLPEEGFVSASERNPGAIYQTALSRFAQVKATRLRTESAEKNIKSLKGGFYPSLFLSGNANTNYSSAAMQSLFVSSIDVPTSDYVFVNGTQQPVFTKQNTFNHQKISLSNQLNNNLFSSVNLGLSIPIFNRNRVRNQVRQAKLELQDAELVEQQTKTALQQEIERAYVNLSNTAERFSILVQQENAFRESFRGAEVRFNAGAITSVDYLVAKNNMDRVSRNLIIAKYDLILRHKILDYYEGKNLW